MIEMIDYQGVMYPKFQANGFAAKFAFPFAQEICRGRGLDIGPGNPEWAFPGATPINDDQACNAYNFPQRELDYIFSSHCLEHLDDWAGALLYWTEALRQGGVLFLYLPDFSQRYWRPWHNRKHRAVFTPEIIRFALFDLGYLKVRTSGVDLNNSFIAIGEKPAQPIR